MSQEVTIAVEPDRLRVTMHGVYSFEKLFGFVDMVRTEVEKAGRRKVLIDCTAMEGKMTEADRFEGGLYVAKVFGPRIQAALVMPKGQVTKLGETAAVNRGAIFFATESMEEADQWLRSPKP